MLNSESELAYLGWPREEFHDRMLKLVRDGVNQV